MLDDMEAQWMRMESRKRAETIEVTSFERRLREIREKRKGEGDTIQKGRENTTRPHEHTTYGPYGGDNKRM